MTIRYVVLLDSSLHMLYMPYTLYMVIIGNHTFYYKGIGLDKTFLKESFLYE